MLLECKWARILQRTCKGAVALGHSCLTDSNPENILLNRRSNQEALVLNFDILQQLHDTQFLPDSERIWKKDFIFVISVPFSRPPKQHITEERMAQHMSRLHISSETPLPIQLEQDEANEQSAERERRLVMCEEMRRLQTDSIIPSALMRR